MGLAVWIRDTNLRVARSPMGRWFRLENSGHVRVAGRRQQDIR